MHQICRTCLKEIEGIRFVNLKDDTNNSEMQNKLLVCLPELNVDLVLGPVLCTSCTDALNSAYIFRTTCLRTEKLIQSYVDTKKLQWNSILLTDFNLQAYLLQASSNEDSNAAFKTETIENDCAQFEFKDLNHIDDMKDIIIKEELILDDIKIDEDDDDLAGKQSSFSCDKCEFETINASSLRVHQEMKHFKKFTCRVCTYETNMESHFTNHMKLHSQESSFQHSTMCSFSTKHKPAVEIHERLSFNKKTICSICGYRTTTFSALKAHMASHNFNIVTGYILYSREVCKEAVQEDPNCNFEELLKTISNEWESLTSLEKLKWVERASGVNTSSKSLDASASPAPTTDHQVSRKYVRKTNRQAWDVEAMTAALKDVEDGSPYKTAAKKHNVPVMALKRRAKGINKCAVRSEKLLGGKQPVFSKEQEKELVAHLHDMETKMNGLTVKDVMNMAFQLAEQKNLKHPFSKEKGKAGYQWLRGFRMRNPDIILRSPEATSAAQARVFNKPIVDKILTNRPDKNELQAEKKRKKALEPEDKRTNKKFKVNLEFKKDTNKTNKQMKSNKIDSSDSDDAIDDDTECMYCTSKYSKNKDGEGWIRCSLCGNWGHNLCAGVDDDNALRYVCDLCTPTR